jgi:nitrogen-specific signal transduction histidine kinase
VLIAFLLLVGLLRLLSNVMFAGQLEERSRRVTTATANNHAVLQALTDAETGVRGYPADRRPDLPAAVRVTGGVQLSVRDTGIGIPEKERSVLFEPFRRARNATAKAIPGTGLGLAIVRAVVHQHHGTVALESTEGARYRHHDHAAGLPGGPAGRAGRPAE